VNEASVGRIVKSALDSGLTLSPDIAARLKVARERALDRQRVRASELVLAQADRTVGRSGGPSSVWPRILLPAAFLVAAAYGLQYWQEAQQAAKASAQQASDLADIDSGVLTGDLPIKAYLDEEFDTWLKRSSE
jgi:nucleotide-binding universal stress UspA family protein